VRCGDPRNRREKRRKGMNLKLVVCLLVHRTMIAP
jgi:hypothetical protein